VIGRRRTGRRLRTLTGAQPPTRRWAALLLVRRRLSVAAVGALAALVALAWAGPVAGLAAAVYAALAVRLVQEREQRRQDGIDEAVALDAVVALAAGLRAGQPVGNAGTALSTVSGASPIVRLVRQRVRAAVQVAEVAGAPLADLLDRLDADLRARRAVTAQGTAHAAGTTATSWLLMALPVAGVGLGYGLGVDPLDQLLHTPLGAGCAALALALQCAGLAWVSRIARAGTVVDG
jgi:tight adherence protein B